MRKTTTEDKTIIIDEIEVQMSKRVFTEITYIAIVEDVEFTICEYADKLPRVAVIKSTLHKKFKDYNVSTDRNQIKSISRKAYYKKLEDWTEEQRKLIRRAIEKF